MLEKLEIFQMASALARHGEVRQSVIAQNIANADTPGYHARDIASFAESYENAAPGQMRATRAGHLLAAPDGGYDPEAREVYRRDAESPNGNNVSIESEMFAAAQARSDHDRALAVYRSAMSILRTAINTRS